MNLDSRPVFYNFNRLSAKWILREAGLSLPCSGEKKPKNSDNMHKKHAVDLGEEYKTGKLRNSPEKWGQPVDNPKV